MKLRLILLFSGMLLSLLAAEIAVRVLQLAPQLGAIEISTPWGGFRRTSSKGYPYAPVSDGRMINAQGMRRALPFDEADSRKRVAVIGDSIAFGFFAGKPMVEEQLFSTLLERALSGKAAVLNFSVPGFDTQQEVAYFEDRVLPLHPSVVVVQFCMNDFCDASAESLKLGKVESAQQGLSSVPLKSLVEHSELFRLIFVRAWVWNLRRQENGDGQFAWCVGRKHPERVRAALVHLAELSVKHDFQIVLLIVPVLRQLLNYRETNEHQILADLAKSLGIEVLDALPVFQAAAAKNQTLDAGDGLHPNRLGHQLLSEQLVPVLESALR